MAATGAAQAFVEINFTGTGTILVRRPILLPGQHARSI